MRNQTDSSSIIRRVMRNGYIVTLFLVALSCIGALALRGSGFPVPALVFLPAVVVVSLYWGSGPAMTASLISLTLYGVLFIPFVRISWDISKYIVYFVEVFVVFGIVAVAASKFRKSADDLRNRAKIKALLLTLSQKVTATRGVEELAATTVKALKQILDADAVLFIPKREQLIPMASSSKEIADRVSDEEEHELATKAWHTGEETGYGGREANEMLYFPLLSAGHTVGVLGVWPKETNWLSDPKRWVFVETLTATIAAAIEREVLARGAAEADALKRQEEFYTALLSSISHDFRTPLASIIGAAETLSLPGAVFSEETRKDILSMIREEAERLNRFVGNLLDMTKLEAGRLNLNLERIEIVDIIGTAIHRLERALEGRRAIVDIEPQLPMIRADFVLVEHVLTNLLENAVKYSPPGKPIHIKAKQKGGEVVISVIDEGRGIPSDELDKIFEKFYRVQRGDLRSAGTGLGLSICKGIVAAHGGKIYAISPIAEGRGTMISFSLPIMGVPEMMVKESVLEHR